MKALWKNLLMLMLLLQCIVLPAQKHSIKALAEVSVQFGLGYEYLLVKKFPLPRRVVCFQNPTARWLLTSSKS